MTTNSSERPNVIMIMTDDQGFWSLGCYGNKEIKTPNLDKLAESGWRFDNFFCVSPVCSPARASLLTGKIPSQHGIHDWLSAGDTSDINLEPQGNGKVIEYLKDHKGYTDILAENGYNCGLSGKWHLGDSHHPQKGFTFWETHAKGGGDYYNGPMIRDGKVYKEPKYMTDAITDNALTFLDQQKNSESPFYLSVHYTAPHSPWGREQHPADLFDEYYDNCMFKSTPDKLSPPEWVKHLSIPVKDKKVRRTYLSGYYASITAMDTNVGRLINWLEKNNLRDNTLICFTSDNGMNMGHHGIYGKGNATYPLNMYEESVKVPFIMSHPKRLKSKKVSKDLLSHYDFMPTLLDYLGMSTSETEQLPGISFCPLLDGNKKSSRENVIIYDEYGPVRMIRTERWKYIHRFPEGPHELYDLKKDPKETSNLYNTKKHQSTVEELKKQLNGWFETYVDPQFDGATEPVTGKGQSSYIDKTKPAEQRFN